jgi:DNA repair protein RecN (Recombination protein N)
MHSDVDRLESRAVEVEDLGGEFESLGGNLDFDSENASDLQTRMAVLLELKRKYGREAEAIVKARAELAARVEEQADIEGTLSRLQKQAAGIEKKCQTLAASLRQSREKAGKQLVKKAGELLTELGFKKASLQVHFQPEKELRAFGDARPEFLFSPNVGEAPLPLARIASSGELARVMLALKTVLAEVDEIPVLVFDEVDANVGGEVGRVVGEKMAAIAKRHQVLCVTHLPQVASLGAQHFVVEKDQDGARAVVRIRAIHHERKERVGELARMLGDRSAKSAQAHAEELLTR